MKKIALINDLSGFGKCSLTAAIPVISVMGMQACPLPTAILTAQTGFEDYVCDDFTDRMDIFTHQWKKMNVTFDGIYSGYLEGGQQIEKVLHFLDAFQTRENLYLADPVMGDHGKPYAMYSEKLLTGMRELIKRADVLTPNLTELCMLAGVDYMEMISHRREKDYIDRVEQICHKLWKNLHSSGIVIVTGILREENEKTYIGNLAVSEKERYYIEHPYTGKGFSGTGDLFASVICGALVKGGTLKQALEKAAYFLQDAIEEASALQIQEVHGVYFEKYLSRLL